MNMKMKFVGLILALTLLSSFWTGESSVLANSMVNQCFENESSCSDASIQPVNNNDSKGGITWVDYVKLIAALFFVVMLLYGLLKFVNSRTKRFQHAKIIHNLGGMSLGANRSIQIVKIAGTFYVVGVGENINLIKEVTDTDEIIRFKHFYSKEETEHRHLNHIFGKEKADGSSFQSMLAKEKSNGVNREEKNKEQY